VRDLPDASAIVSDVFARDVVAFWSALPSSARRDTFFAWWTCLEAFGKARGAGVRDAFGIDLDVLSAIASRTPTPRAIHAQGTDQDFAAAAVPCPPGFRTTVAAERSDWHVRVMDGDDLVNEQS